MFGIHDIWAYTLTALVLILLPGPNSMFCLSIASTLGAKKARFAMMGTFLGNGMLIVASALGAGTLLQLYPALFGVLKLIGAVYLAYLGIHLIYHAMHQKTVHTASAEPTSSVQTSSVQIFKKALFIALLNPKGLLFFPSMMVQFVATDYAYPLLSFAILGAIFQMISLIFLTMVAHFAQLILTHVRQFSVLAKLGKTTVGSLFIYFALRLVWA